MEVSKNIEKIETHIATVASVATQKPLLTETASNNLEQPAAPDSKIIYFDRLAPNDFHTCDGLGHDAIAAEFVCFNDNGKASGYWCKTHLFKIGKDCSQNGFTLLEKPPICAECTEEIAQELQGEDS